MARRVLSISDVTAEHWAEIAKVTTMIRYSIPLTRENYLSLAYGSEVPKGDDWGRRVGGRPAVAAPTGRVRRSADVAERLGIYLD